LLEHHELPVCVNTCVIAHEAEDAAGPAASAATDTTVQPANTAINRENSRFSEIRPKALVIFVIFVLLV